MFLFLFSQFYQQLLYIFWFGCYFIIFFFRSHFPPVFIPAAFFWGGVNVGVKTMWLFSINVSTCWNDTTDAAMWCHHFHLLFSVLFSIDPSPIVKHRLTSTLDGRYILVSEKQYLHNRGAEAKYFLWHKTKNSAQEQNIEKGKTSFRRSYYIFYVTKMWHLWYSNFSFMDVALSRLTPRIWQCLSVS